MLNPLWTDQKLIQSITGPDPQRNQALKYIYQNQDWRAAAFSYVLRKGGNESDAEDAFQEVVILFDRNLRDDKFRGNSALKTYFIGIIKWHWLGQIRKRKPVGEINDRVHGGSEPGVEARIIEEEKKDFLRLALKQLGERCEKVLSMYALKVSMQEIAEKLDLPSIDAAKQAARRCRNKLRDFFNDHPGWR